MARLMPSGPLADDLPGSMWANLQALNASQTQVANLQHSADEITKLLICDDLPVKLPGFTTQGQKGSCFGRQC